MNDILNKEIPIPKKLSVEARDFLRQVLKKKPEERMACREGGFEELQAHPFFRSIDWELLYMKDITPPFVPDVEDSSDVQNVDKEFLSEMPEETPVQQSELAAMASEEGDFDNFTYVNENKFSEIESGTNDQLRRNQTELLNMRNSFAVVGDPQEDDAQQAGIARQTTAVNQSRATSDMFG